jgi:phosphatidate cytidylyltransferase
LRIPATCLAKFQNRKSKYAGDIPGYNEWRSIERLLLLALMKIRVLTALAILFPAAYLLGWAPKWLFMAALIALVERGLYEYFFISRQAGFEFFPMLGYAAAAVVCLAQWLALRRFGASELAVLMVFVLLIPAFAVWLAQDLKRYLAAVSTTLFGVFYIAFTLSCLFPLRFSAAGAQFANGRQIVFFLFVVICVGDIFAYFTGRLLGRRPLFPRVSPKKTVEGAFGGLIASIVAGWAYARGFWQTADWKTVILLAGLVAICGQVGDLTESSLKRAANLKDSGAILPGHGGLLDRVDSLLFGAPVFWLALVVAQWFRK